MSISQFAAEHAKDKVKSLLHRLLGPDLAGVVAFGVRFDTRTRDLCVGIDLDPNVPESLVGSIPSNVEDVPVQVTRREPSEMEWSE